MRIFKTPAELKDHVGETLGESDWLEIDQERINTFADATGDQSQVTTLSSSAWAASIASSTLISSAKISPV